MSVTWDMVERFVDAVSGICAKRRFAGVYGFPRGGLPLAVWISHRAGLPLLLAPAEDALLVDDIADTGATLFRYRKSHFIATMFYHRQSSVVPDFWMFEKKNDEWVVFPWEI